jgi:hypothetical protein
VADTPADEPAGPSGSDDDRVDLEAMEERLHELGERIAATRTQAEGDDLLPRKDGSGGGGGDGFSDALGFSDHADTGRSQPGNTGRTVDDPGPTPTSSDAPDEPTGEHEPGEADGPGESG